MKKRCRNSEQTSGEIKYALPKSLHRVVGNTVWLRFFDENSRSKDAINRRQDERLILVETAIYRVWCLNRTVLGAFALSVTVGVASPSGEGYRRSPLPHFHH
ncbi:hypothetical protein H1Q63_05435 [Desmonostoc muscorum CCALA 125]|nr:hypothetical protein [Desmonostoc muscorum CCALA 125]